MLRGTWPSPLPFGLNTSLKVQGECKYQCEFRCQHQHRVLGREGSRGASGDDSRETSAYALVPSSCEGGCLSSLVSMRTLTVRMDTLLYLVKATGVNAHANDAAHNTANLLLPGRRTFCSVSPGSTRPSCPDCSCARIWMSIRWCVNMGGCEAMLFIDWRNPSTMRCDWRRQDGLGFPRGGVCPV